MLYIQPNTITHPASSQWEGAAVHPSSCCYIFLEFRNYFLPCPSLLFISNSVFVEYSTGISAGGMSVRSTHMLHPSSAQWALSPCCACAAWSLLQSEQRHESGGRCVCVWWVIKQEWESCKTSRGKSLSIWLVAVVIAQCLGLFFFVLGCISARCAVSDSTTLKKNKDIIKIFYGLTFLGLRNAWLYGIVLLSSLVVYIAENNSSGALLQGMNRR